MARPSNRSNNNDWMTKGSVGAETSRREVAKQAARREEMKNQKFKPFRFYLKQGESANVVILDHSLEDIRFYYEHNFYNQSTKNELNPPELCAGDFGECPACTGELSPQKGHKYRYYAMFISILDTRAYTRKAKDGQPEQRVLYTRKLLMVKAGQHDQFMEVLRNAEQKYGTLNGVVLKLQRSNSSESTGVGEPVIIHDGRQFAQYKKETMLKRFGHPPLKNKDGEVYLEANGSLEPWDYNDVFERPEPNAMRKRWGLAEKNTSGGEDSSIHGSVSSVSSVSSDEFDDDFNDFNDSSDGEASNVDTSDTQQEENKSTDAPQDFDNFEDDSNIPFD